MNYELGSKIDDESREDGMYACHVSLVMQLPLH